MAGTFTVAGLASGLATGSKLMGPLTITGTAVVGETLDLNLSSGDTTVTIPPNAVAAWIVPPSTNTQALKVRTSANSGDAGLPISATDPFGPYSFRAVSPAPTTLIVNAAGTVTGVEIVFI